MTVASLGWQANAAEVKLEPAAKVAVRDEAPNIAEKMQVINLRTQYERNPLCVDEAKPQLSWELLSPVRGARESAYQVLVASSRELLDRDEGDCWDSGKVSGDASRVRYGGHPVIAPKVAYWKVRVWNKLGEASGWSEMASWGGGMPESAWRNAQWISGEGRWDREEAPSPWFRKTFELPFTATRAMAYVAVAGYEELYVNGRKVGSDVLSPAVSDDRKRVFYVVYDITSFLQEGQNAVGIWAGRGWFISPLSPRVRFFARIESAQGEVMELTSDEGWKTTASPYTSVGTYGFGRFGGERYDARLEQPDWALPDFDDSSWGTPQKVAAPSGALEVQPCPLNRIGKTIEAVSCEPGEEGAYKIDFGTNLSGWLRLEIPALPEGNQVEFVCSDGKGKYNQKDTYISSGQPGVFQNKFSYHGFRYVTVKGLPREPRLNEAQAFLVESDLEEAGSFACSNELLNRIHDLHAWTYRCLDLGGYTVDCPHRERLGYGADGQAIIETGVHNFWVPAFYRKWLDDWILSQNPETGAVPNTVPSKWGGGGPAWGAMLNIMTWRLYQYYGDLQVLERSQEAMRKYLEFLESHSPDNLMQPYGKQKWDFLGDWVAPERGMENNGANWPSIEAICFFNDCYRIYLWQIQEKTATLLGDEEEAVHCRERIAAIRSSAHEAYFNEEGSYYALDEQPYLVMPLMTGVPPESARAQVEDRLIERIRIHAQNHVETGILGTWFLIEYLQENGRDDILFDIATQETYPGWGYMLAQGATTMWEQWNGYGTQIHACFVSLDRWFYQGIAGIRPEEPGYRKILIKPAVVGDLTWAKARVHSVYGWIESSWKRDGKHLSLDVTIPANTTARVLVPGLPGSIREGDVAAKSAEGVRYLEEVPGGVAYEVASGCYHFTSILDER
ncbi:family 78 glycoside hydrolase catalytic domain [Coraliomargarita parva]|uniref:family 78 glycoside hydrolase catalytic domain n=1 Tax=Coraliomargarita parva TaxID=3014050 RepID=UPI0022B4A09A|nr:family 78 glycoside hydrolase catalytic domain [Coraliomargarita parva]